MFPNKRKTSRSGIEWKCFVNICSLGFKSKIKLVSTIPVEFYEDKQVFENQ